MKKLLLTLIVLPFLTSCGVAEHITQTCTGDLEQVCDVFFGGNKDDNQDKDIDYQRNQIDRLNALVQQLESDNQLNKNAISSLTIDASLLRSDILANTIEIDTLKIAQLALENSLIALSVNVSSNAALISALQSQLNNLQGATTIDINNLNSAITLINAAIGNLQSQSNNNQTTLAVLQGYNNITELVDPCGDGAGYDEVLLRLSDGKLLASLSTSSNATSTRLSEVPPSDSVTYQSTDGTACNFKIPATGPNAKKVCFGAGFNTCF